MQRGGSSAVDVKIFSLVNEVTKSKDETIASKNYTIQLLESMLQNQKKCTTCAAVNVTE
jgi:molybdopterin converting factor small subunit